MIWGDFVKNNDFLDRCEYLLTIIECPDCGNQIYVNIENVLPSKPPKHKYKCMICGWEGEA
jgi:predicted RNA-binding Zn-ribbon protein involved in translation (DUF1610 family)